jgi:membrane protease YdiL (CAAX protease family)
MNTTGNIAKLYMRCEMATRVLDEHTDRRPAPAVRAFVRRHPIATYVALATTWSWAWWLPIALGDQVVEVGSAGPTHLPGLLGPGVAAIAVSWLTGAGEGVNSLLRRLLRWRTAVWWAVAAVLAIGGVAVLASTSTSASLIEYSGVDASLGVVATVLLVLVVNGVGEELGWRGYMADTLLHRHGLIATSLLVVAAWAPWHAPLFWGLDSFAGFSVGELLGWLIGITCGSVVLTWLYQRSGSSVLLVAVWHTAYNFTVATPGTQGAPAAIVSTVVMVAAVVIVALELLQTRRVFRRR